MPSCLWHREGGPPDAYLLTRGPYADMYRGRAWPLRQDASAEESNERHRDVLGAERVDGFGGAVAAIEQRFIQDEIEQSAFGGIGGRARRARVMVGVNADVEHGAEQVELHRIDPAAERRQLERAARIWAERNVDDTSRALDAVRDAARGNANLLPVMREALWAVCTVGEICETLRAERGMSDQVR